MNKILIIGGSGSGKSYLANKLSEKLNIPVLHLDTIFWSPGWVKREKSKFLSDLESFMKNETGIIDGYYESSFLERINWCDTIIFLDFSTFNLLQSVILRFIKIKFLGATRHTIAEGCPEKIDLEFLKWVYSFNKDNREKIVSYITNSKKKVYILRNKGEVDKFILDFEV